MPPHVIAKPPATRAYTLWDRKADRMPVTNWSYVPMPEEALSRLQVGDAVRLLLMDSDGGSGWEKIYFEITSIDYYSKGQSGKARKFRGRAMDTYRDSWDLRYVSTGDEISFQRRNIMEVPGWHLDSFGFAKGVGSKQSNLAEVQPELQRVRHEEDAAIDAAWERQKQLERRERQQRRERTLAAAAISAAAAGVAFVAIARAASK